VTPMSFSIEMLVFVLVAGLVLGWLQRSRR
jgi:hypothetical protein